MRKSLNEQFEIIVNKYIKAFERKHKVKFEFWVDDNIGGICVINSDFCFNFIENIKVDIDYNRPSHLIWEWYEQKMIKQVQLYKYYKGDTNYHKFTNVFYTEMIKPLNMIK